MACSMCEEIMLKRFFELTGIAALVFGIFFSVMAFISYNQHAAMKKKGKPVQATVVTTYESTTRTGSSSNASRSYAYIALVQFADPFSATEKKMEYGFPVKRPDIIPGAQLSMVYNPDGEMIMMKEHIREPFDAMKTPAAIGGVFFFAGALLLSVRWKFFS
ncbi:MAG TPA: hypothetical protein PK544_17640 [Spirochaetota bacterium]|nr:hypothetical protein [Spirochaetota bacterium]